MPRPVVTRLCEDARATTALRRWRSRRPDFDAVLKIAKLAGHRQRMRNRCADAPELTETIADHIIHGGSPRSAAQTVPGAPHPVTLYGWTGRRPDFAAEIAAPPASATPCSSTASWTPKAATPPCANG